jgi:hypothetical protein
MALAAKDTAAMNKAPRRQLVTLVGLTVGCGARTDLLVDDAVPLADAMPDVDVMVEEPTPPVDATAVPNSDVGVSDASSEVGTDDADAAASPAGQLDSGCGPDTCDGCCREDGVCVARAAVTARFCGSGGYRCLECPPGILCGVDTADQTIVCGHFL